MPIYEYLCNDCKERHEIIQRFSDAPLTHCPSCGGAMRKLVSSPAIQFKGSGWYKTDYAGSGSKPSSKSDGASENGSEAKSETSKSETKSESKASD